MKLEVAKRNQGKFFLPVTKRNPSFKVWANICKEESSETLHLLVWVNKRNPLFTSTLNLQRGIKENFSYQLTSETLL